MPSKNTSNAPAPLVFDPQIVAYLDEGTSPGDVRLTAEVGHKIDLFVGATQIASFNRPLDKGHVGLPAADNTSDLAKPISTATQAALDTKADALFTVPNARILTAGAGLTGGGNLTADRTFTVGAGTGITVNADDVALTVPVTIANGGTGGTTASAARSALGLGNVDNTSDLSKPISTATQTALNLKADVGSGGGTPSDAIPAMDGTAAAGSSTAYARGDHVHPTDTSRAPLASPTFTGVPAAPTAATGTNTTQLATTQFVMTSAVNYDRTVTAGAGLTGGGQLNVNRTFDVGAGTGITVAADSVGLTVPVAVVNGGTGAITAPAALTALGAAPLASPAFTGTPTAPTATLNTNTTQVATTAFVVTQVGSYTPASRTIGSGAGLTGGGDLTNNRTFDVGAGTGITVGADTVALTVPVAIVNGGTGAITAPDALVALGAIGDPPDGEIYGRRGGIIPEWVLLATGATGATGSTGDPSDDVPLMDGVGAVGTSVEYARGDHVHPSDTSRAPIASPTFTGIPAAPTASVVTSTTQIATTAFAQSLFALGVPVARSVTAGAGLSGGGQLNADRTFTVGAGTGITVNADDVALTVPVAVANGGTGAITPSAALTALGAQAASTNLAALASVSPGANTLPFFNSSTTCQLANFTSFGRSLVDDADAVAARQTLVGAINAQTGTTYTFVLTDAEKLVTFSNAAAVTVTIPTNATAAFATGAQIDIVQTGAGKVTLAPAGGVTINSQAANKALAAQYAGATLRKTATDTWLLVGNLIA